MKQIANIALAFILLLYISSIARAEGVIIYGNDFAFSILAPGGWIIDTKSMAAEGMNVVMYPKGYSAVSAPSIIYARVIPNGRNSLEEIVLDDERDFLNGCPSGHAKDAGVLKTRMGFPAMTRIFMCPGNSYELVTYLEGERKAVIFVLNSRTENDYKKNVVNHEKVINSYYWVVSNVNDGK